MTTADPQRQRRKSRATVTAAAMARAIAAAKEGLRVTLVADGSMIIEPAPESAQTAPLSAYDEWSKKRGQG